jgi:hypothetical protein
LARSPDPLQEGIRTVRIQQLKTSPEGVADGASAKAAAPASGSSALAAPGATASSPAAPARAPSGAASGGAANGVAARPAAESRTAEQPDPDQQTSSHQVLERQAVEIALLKARIQHLELVVETARSLMGSNQERLLRRLHEVPREIVGLSAQLHRLDPQASW